ncbi:hypothetical protein J7F01_36000 [Streptomyces sp. ISL-22]|uniref:Uncharacterized protein n=2 Tax=Streptomyces TaxID=1883 RepID=A0A117NYT0_9ACTN|nr:MULTISPECIES: hypothetical protein [Streptomyces]ELS51422.1 hypothetical protein STVIR_7606 [Streptomyces viridochromogenes Tue57]KUM69889.1 hypothetical protein AQI70_30070 [Streptomyces curacoi]MBT2416288.1 hypothetical protein [Streptomyces sp. ISL-24]MBT2437465.1 hypothetical protein [Streptomyces sp. ISL-22]
MDGRHDVAFFPSFRNADDDTEDPADCPWCAALGASTLPPTAQPSRPQGRRYDPYVSGAPYDGDDW